ncbi:MAG: tRNA dihydrouridine synthase DusB [Candidatus Omnitrophota bacterium]
MGDVNKDMESFKNNINNQDPIAQMIKARAVLAPMAGVTDIPFRLMARKFGCEFAFTEMIDINGIIYNNRKTFNLMRRIEQDLPLGIQLVGEDSDKMLRVAKICAEKGYRVIDVNAGCPVRKVTKAGKGSALLKEPRKLSEMIKKLVKGLDVAVTLKIRSGWDENSKNYLKIAEIAEQEGVRAICVHPRTQAAMYKGRADWDVIAEVKEKLSIPVFASGNIFKASDASDVVHHTGCDAVFVARGALGKPWIFDDIKRYFSGDTEQRTPGFSEIKDIISRHFNMAIEIYEEGLALRRMYKYITWYLKSFKNLDMVMKEYRKAKNKKEADIFMERLLLNEKNRMFFGE